MGHRFLATLSRSSRRPCTKAILSSWITCAPTISDGVHQAVEAIRAKVRYLPAYSPDLNPIDMAFSKLKTALRNGAARTVTTLTKLIGNLIYTFEPEHCTNYFRHAGYTL